MVNKTTTGISISIIWIIQDLISYSWLDLTNPGRSLALSYYNDLTQCMAPYNEAFII